MNAVVYQVYPRSFADSDGDGVGDLRGLLSRLDHIADLGVDAIWLSPFYASPLADGGYDITDHRAVHPALGTLADVDRIIERVHELGLGLIIDVVPNHTSIEHPWFVEAVRGGPGSPARDRYVFRPGTGAGGHAPPSDWRSHFGGSAWERLADGEWYLHLFAKDQADLNWADEEVREYFLGTLRFWADRGVDGFRVDVAFALAKDLRDPLRSQPHLETRLPDDGSDPLYDRDEGHAIYRSWREVLDGYDPPRTSVAETWYPATDRMYLYARPEELGQVFDFSLLKAHWDADRYRAVIDRSLAGIRPTGGGLTWVLSSHDVPRHASRLALPGDVRAEDWVHSNGLAPPVDVALGLSRARAATLMMLALPGSSYLYQGEELGLPEVADLAVEHIRDPIWTWSEGSVKGRDGCRVPIPWSSRGPSFGFGAGGSWLPQPACFADYAAERQRGQPGSTLEMYRAALRRRRDSGALRGPHFGWLEAGRDVLAFERGPDLRCMVNMSPSGVRLPGPPWRVDVASRPFVGAELPPDHAVWLVRDARPAS